MMRHRARVRRHEDTGDTDDYGEPVRDWTEVAAEQPCYVWMRQTRGEADEARGVVLTDARAMMPLDIDVASGDRLSNIVDRRGTTILDGAWEVDGKVARRKAHLEMPLTQVDG